MQIVLALVMAHTTLPKRGIVSWVFIVRFVVSPEERCARQEFDFYGRLWRELTTIGFGERFDF
jgi:hypothetical protein